MPRRVKSTGSRSAHWTGPDSTSWLPHMVEDKPKPKAKSQKGRDSVGTKRRIRSY